jgi:SulP family sulfate permease
MLSSIRSLAGGSSPNGTPAPAVNGHANHGSSSAREGNDGDNIIDVELIGTEEELVQRYHQTKPWHLTGSKERVKSRASSASGGAATVVDSNGDSNSNSNGHANNSNNNNDGEAPNNDDGNREWALHARTDMKIEPKKTPKEYLYKYIPALSWLAKYDTKKTLRTDLIAGLVIGFMLIPQGMAYGLLAGLPVQYGLYSSIFPPLMYGLFGTSAHLSFGTNAPISILVADSVSSVIDTETDCAFDTESEDCAIIIEATLCLSIMCSCFYLLFFLFRLGIVTSLVPDSVLAGFTTGASVIIISSNMKHVIGIPIDSGSVISIWRDIFSKFSDWNWIAVTLFFTAFCMIFAIKHVNFKYKERLFIPIPEQLVVLIVYILITWVLDLDVPVTGDIPAGLYSPSFPPLFDSEKNYFSKLLQPALVCSIVTYILTINVAKSLGDKYNYYVDADQEFIANAVAAMVGGITGSFLPSGSFSRSALVGDCNPEGTALHNFFSSILVILVLLWLTPLLFYMPKAIMASIIFAALKNMINIQTGRLLYKVNKTDFTLFMVSFLCTAFLGVTYGIACSIVAAILVLVKAQARPPTKILGRLGYTAFYENVKTFPNALETPGVKIFRIDASLTFANKDFVEEKLKKMERRAILNDPEDFKFLVFDCTS